MTLQELHLENPNAGDKIVCVRDGKTVGGITVILEFDERIKRFRIGRIGDPERKTAATFPPDGTGYHFMSKRTKPDFFYSANPTHIREAEKRIRKAKKLREKKELEAERIHSITRPIAEEFDVEPNVKQDIIETLTHKLTEPQLMTLREWLSID